MAADGFRAKSRGLFASKTVPAVPGSPFSVGASAHSVFEIAVPSTAAAVDPGARVQKTVQRTPVAPAAPDTLFPTHGLDSPHSLRNIGHNVVSSTHNSLPGSPHGLFNSFLAGMFGQTVTEVVFPSDLSDLNIPARDLILQP